MRSHFASSLLAITVVGCATTAATPEDVALANTPLYCSGEQECKTAWRRAQVWVVENAGYKLQTTTDAILETYNAPDFSTRLAMRVLREPGPNGLDRITLGLSCGKMPMCSQNHDTLTASFKRYVSRPTALK